MKKLRILALLAGTTAICAGVVTSTNSFNKGASQNVQSTLQGEKTSPFQCGIIEKQLFCNDKFGYEYQDILLFDTYDILLISELKAKFVGSNGQDIKSVSLIFDWANYKPGASGLGLGTNGVVKGIIKSPTNNEEGKIVISYKGPGATKSLPIYESKVFSFQNKNPDDGFNKFSKILNNKTEFPNVIRDAITFTKNTSDKENDFTFNMQNEFGNTLSSWVPIVNWNGDQANISFKFTSPKSDDLYLQSFVGRIVAIKDSEIIDISENKNFEINLISDLEILNREAFNGKKIKNGALLWINDKYVNENFSIRLLDENNSEITSWKAIFESGWSQRNISFIPMDNVFGSTFLKVEISANESVVNISDLIELKNIKDDAGIHANEYSSVSFTFTDNIFYIEPNKNILKTITAGTLFGINSPDFSEQDIKVKPFERWRELNDAFQVNILEKNQDKNSAKFNLSAIDKNIFRGSKKINVYIEIGSYKSGVISICEAPAKNEQLIYTNANNNITSDDTKIIFNNAFEVYTGSKFLSEPWKKIDHKLIDKNGKQLSAEFKFDSILCNDFAIGYYVSVIFQDVDVSSLGKLQITNENGEKITGKEMFFSKNNASLNVNDFNITNLAKTNKFFDFEIPDISLDWNDMKVVVKNNFGKTITDYRVVLDNAGEYTFASIDFKDKTNPCFTSFIKVEVWIDGEIALSSNDIQMFDYEISGYIHKWQGDNFGFSSGIINGFFDFDLENSTFEKCTYDLVNKYGDSMLSQGWSVFAQKIDKNHGRAYINCPKQFNIPDDQEIKIQIKIYNKIIAESEVISLSILNPICSENRQWEYTTQGFSSSVWHIEKNDNPIVTYNNFLKLSKNAFSRKSLLEIKDQIRIEIGNENAWLSLNGKTSDENNLYYNLHTKFDKLITKKTPTDVKIASTTNLIKYESKFFVNPRVFYKDNFIFEMVGQEFTINGNIAHTYNSASYTRPNCYTIHSVESIKNTTSGF